MSRDLWLPPKMSRIHQTRRTPYIAVFVTGFILIIMAVTLPIEAVGSAASLIFLLTFAMVNLSLIALRRKYPEIPRRYHVPLYPYLPILGFSLNIFLALYQFNFQPIAWYVTIGWIAVGLLLYYAVFEKKAAAFEPQVLLPGTPLPEAENASSVLISLHNPDNVEILMRIGMSVARQRQVGLIATSVVTVPRQVPIHEGLRFAHHKEPLLSEAKRIASQQQIKLETDLVIAHNAADGILAAVDKHNAEALIMGWKGFTNAKDRIFGEIADQIIRLAPCDLLVLKIGEKKGWDKCLLPTAGGPNAQLASNVLNSMAKEFNMSVTAGYIIHENATKEERDIAEERMDSTLSKLDSEIESGKKIIESKSIAGGIAKASRDYDLVVIGAAKEPFFKKMLFGEIPEKVARYSPNSVLVVKKYEGVLKNIFKRILG
jgi:APA family basic amino acid/polyamine antiporter